MCELAAQYPRYGYRRVRIFLGREGLVMGPDRAHRLWRQAGLQVPRRRPRRRVAASRPRPLPPTGPNHVWAYDFVFDTSATGQQIKCLTVVDEWTREALAIDVAGSIPRRQGHRRARATRQRSRGAPLSSGPTTGPSLCPARSCAGPRQRASRPRTSLRASPGRTAPTRALTAAFARSASAWSGFARDERQRRSSRRGGVTTTRSDRTQVSAI